MEHLESDAFGIQSKVCLLTFGFVDIWMLSYAASESLELSAFTHNVSPASLFQQVPIKHLMDRAHSGTCSIYFSIVHHLKYQHRY